MLPNTSFQSLDPKIASQEAAKAFAISQSLLMAKNILVQGNQFLFSMNGLLNALVLAISAVLYLTVFMRFYSVLELRKGTIVLTLALILFWMIPIYTNSNFFDDQNVQNEFTSFLLYGFPGFFLLSLLKDCDVLLDTFYKMRGFLFAISFCSIALILTTGFESAKDTYAEYSMALGSNMVFPAFLFISAWFRDRKIYDFFGMLFFILSVLLFASRYPLVCIVAFLGLQIFRRARSSRNRALVVVILLFVVVLLPFCQSILNWCYEVLLEQNGIRSRTLSLLLEGNLGDDSGRFQIYQKLLMAIKCSPLLGFGAAGGTVALGDDIPHSFLLDVFASFGYLFGAAVLALSAWGIVRLYRNNRRRSNREYIFMCLCAFLPIFLFQRSFFTAQYFWYLLGMVCGQMTDGEKKKTTVEVSESV